MSYCTCSPCQPDDGPEWDCPDHGHLVLPRIYVAGGSGERLTVVQPMIRRLQAEGARITHDWTLCPGFDYDGTPAELAGWAREDLEGVRNADLVWVMVPEDKSEGAHAELGAAIILGKTVFASGPHCYSARRIFPLLASRVFATHDAAFRAIVRKAKPGPHKANG